MRQNRGVATDRILPDADISAVATLIGEKTRSELITALSDDRALSSAELAVVAGVTAATASFHLSKLEEAGLVRSDRRGKHKFYSLGSPEVAEAIESLARIAPPRRMRSLKDSVRSEAIRDARTCYDHLAGTLGVALAVSFEQRRLVRMTDGSYFLTKSGERVLAELGIDVPDLRRGRRQLVRPCLDWSERRPHIGGAIGASLAGRFFDLGWIERIPGTRAIKVTGRGTAELHRRFGLEQS